MKTEKCRIKQVDRCGSHQYGVDSMAGWRRLGEDMKGGFGGKGG